MVSQMGRTEEKQTNIKKEIKNRVKVLNLRKKGVYL